MPLRSSALRRPTCSPGSWRRPRCRAAIAESAHTLYQFSERWVVDDTAISAWFGVLALSAALLGPAGVGLGRLAGGRTGTWIAATGIAAALVQVTGLSRWVLFVPGLSDDALVPADAPDAYHRFRLLHTWLGTVVGETIGYAPDALRRLRELVRMAGGHGHRAVARHPDGLGRHSRGSSR
jgi:hypothetical protein